MSHRMSHHIESKYSLNCCIYLIWLEFETWFEFELKTLEKINRKGNRNSRKKEKAISAQASLISLARAPPVSDRRVPPVGANQRAHSSPSLSLAALWGWAVGAVLFPRTLSLCSAVPTCQPSLTFRPRSPRRGRTHDRAFSGHVRAPAPLLSPAPSSPSPPLSFAPFAQLSRPLARSAHANRELHHRLPTPIACSMATVAPVPRPVPQWASPYCQLLGTPFGVPSPSLLRPVHAYRSVFLRSRSPPPSPHWTPATPSLLRDASASARGEQPAHALNLVIPAL
jgi:hypothetical protein